MLTEDKLKSKREATLNNQQAFIIPSISEVDVMTVEIIVDQKRYRALGGRTTPIRPGIRAMEAGLLAMVSFESGLPASLMSLEGQQIPWQLSLRWNLQLDAGLTVHNCQWTLVVLDPLGSGSLNFQL